MMSRPIHITVKPLTRSNPVVSARPLNAQIKSAKPTVNSIVARRPIYSLSRQPAAVAAVVHHHKNLPKASSRSLSKQIQPVIQHRIHQTPVSPLSQALGPLQGSGKGRILIIVGNGPSRTEVPLERLKNQPNIDIMTINKPDDRVWPTKYWTFCDDSQRRRHKPQFDTYTGYIFSTASARENKANVLKLPNLTGTGFSLNPLRGVHIGRSSSYVGMQIAAWMEYDHIYLFGVDMTAVNGKLYPWGHNPDVDDSTRMLRFKHEAESYNWAGSHLTPEVRGKFTFCSRYNPFEFPDKFTRWDHTGAVEKIIEHTTKLQGK